MEQKMYNVHQLQENKSFIEINRQEIDGTNYILLLQNEAPNAFYIGLINKDNKIEFVLDKKLVTKIFIEMTKNSKTIDSLKILIDSIKNSNR